MSLEQWQILGQVVIILLFCLTLLGGYKYVILTGQRVEIALQEIKDIKLKVNNHSDEIGEIKSVMAYEAGVTKGKAIGHAGGAI